MKLTMRPSAVIFGDSMSSPLFKPDDYRLPVVVPFTLKR